MKVGMSTSCLFRRYEIEDSIEPIAKMGVNDIEAYFGAYSEYTPEFMRDIKLRADDNNIKIRSMHTLSLHFEPHLFNIGTRTQRDAIDMFKRTLEGGSIMGAEVYVFHGGARLRRNVDMPFSIERITDCTDMLADIAKEYGIKLGFENVHWCMYHYPGFAKELLEHTNSDNIFFTLDIKQAIQSECGYDDYISDMGDKIHNVHICDIIERENRAPKTALPFNGGIDFAALKQSLQTVGYNGMVMLEVYPNDFNELSELKESYIKAKELFEG